MPDLSQEIVKQLPYLRRYARALTGSQARGDEYIKVCLETLIEEPNRISADSSIRLQLFRLFHDVWSIVDSAVPQAEPREDRSESLVKARLDALPPRERQALLLVQLERFSVDQAASILQVNDKEIRRLLEQAREDLKRQAATTVLIIEDEPIIALDIAGIVRDMGHAVVGIASRQNDAIAMARTTLPGLVLADIQLEEGGSGIAAVQEILQSIDVPVIFVTAYPEKLLTGTRAEPTYLVTKPFEPDVLKVTISQALSFQPQDAASAKATMASARS
jgi:CheY-like chemotaxis protein/DNA-directed RNA polymerase specialized sigma24 family protein